MSEEKKMLKVSASPHIKGPATVTGLMAHVLIALIPALFAAVAIFGFRALLLTAFSVAVCVAAEYVTRRLLKRSGSLGDLSAVVTGVLLAFNMPVDVPLWMLAVGDIVAIVVVKQFFGGLGHNFANPAIVGRIVLLVSFPSAMSSFAEPLRWKSGVDAVTGATVLSTLSKLDLSGGASSALQAERLPDMMSMFFGVRGGCIGEVCAFALIIGGVYLMITKVIKPVIPCAFIGTVAVVMLIAGKGSPAFVAYHLMSGGLLLGAFFMATDYVTSPTSFGARLAFGIGCGLVTSVIRLFGSLPEGVSYSILLMNVCAPLLDRIFYPRAFGAEKKRRTAK